MKIQFHGAAGEVTGSCHLVDVAGHSVLLDCGLVQGNRKEVLRNRQPFPFDPKQIDALVLSHAHIDHSGRIPALVKAGFTGLIYAHPATRDLCRILLKDSAYLNEKETEWENRKRERKGIARLEPLYTQADAAYAMKQFKPLPYDRSKVILPGVQVTLRDAGHILGSAIVEVLLEEHGEQRKIVFSGDLGHAGAPILRDPTPIRDADLVLMESTYGDRLHKSWDDTQDEVMDIVAQAKAAKGNILIPAFAVGRSQLLIYWMATNYDEAGLDRWRVFLDSPLAIRATGVYAHYEQLYDSEARALWEQRRGDSLLPNLHISKTTKQSIAINNIRSGAIVIAGSGMCTGGRIRQHLKHNIWRKECHVVITGFQARGTTGRALVDGASHIRLWGERIRVAAKIHTIGGLSAHADQSELVNWYGQFRNRPPVVLVHGESKPLEALSNRLRDKLNANVQIATPAYTFDLLQARAA